MTTSDRGATIVDVAARAGVSAATVSRALRGLPNVTDTTRGRVLSAAGELRYRPHPHASRLAAGKTFTIGIALPIVGQWYCAKVLAGVESVLAPAGYDLLVLGAPTHDSRRRLVTEADSFRVRIDGLILVDMQVSPRDVPGLTDSGLRIVSVGQQVPSIPSIGVDDVGAAVLAVRHLVNLGHRRIGFIGAGVEDRTNGPLDDRRRGYAAEMRRHRFRVQRELLVEAELTVDGGCVAMERLLSLASPPTAVFAISDELAIGAIDAVRRHGYEVPRHVSVVGFDDHDLAGALGLTTIRQLPVRHGQTGAWMLLAQLRGEPAQHLHRRDEAQLVVRSTTRRLGGA